jgi:hypothetical protein
VGEQEKTVLFQRFAARCSPSEGDERVHRTGFVSGGAISGSESRTSSCFWAPIDHPGDSAGYSRFLILLLL